MNNLDSLTLDNICSGAVAERFQRSLQQILKNIRDVNAPAKSKRSLTMEFTFEPHVDRCGAEVSFKIKEKLVGDEVVKGNIYMAQNQNGLTAYPRDIRQEVLFNGENKTDRAV
jgi:hypothetical protein